MRLEPPDPRDGSTAGATSPTEQADAANSPTERTGAPAAPTAQAGAADSASPERQPRVVVADDLATMRRLLARLAERAGFEVVAEVGTTDALVEAVGRLAPDVALTDVEMPGPPLIEVLEALRERAPATAVLVHTGHADAASVKRLTAAGAREVIAKGSPVEHLVAVLRAAVDGGAKTLPTDDPAEADLEG